MSTATPSKASSTPSSRASSRRRATPTPCSSSPPSREENNVNRESRIVNRPAAGRLELWTQAGSPLKHDSRFTIHDSRPSMLYRTHLIGALRARRVDFVDFERTVRGEVGELAARLRALAGRSAAEVLEASGAVAARVAYP